MSTASPTRHLGAMLLRSLGTSLLVAGASQVAAQTTSITLCVEPYTLTSLPGVASVPMWGYREVTDPNSCSAAPAARTSAAAPLITLNPGDTTLAITLVNRLTVPTSMVIAGQRLAVDGGAPVMAPDVAGTATCTPSPGAAADSPDHPQNCRVRSFTGETAPGASRTYTFSGLKPGTYLYQSGTHPQVQVQMGLAGMVRLDGQAAGGTTRQLTTNAATIFDVDVPVVLSEIDDAMHQRIADTLGSATPETWQAGRNSTLNYKPRFFLVNGRPFDGAGATDLPVSAFNYAYVLLRVANAGLQSRSLVLNNGHWQLLAEDGNEYPGAREQYSALLPAGKTTDARLLVALPSSTTDVTRFALFDRRGGTDNADASPLGGQVAQLLVSNTATAPGNLADLAITMTDGATTVARGSTLTYVIGVRNNGPEAVTGATVTDLVPAALTGVSWTCTAGANAACGAPSGTGNLSASVNLGVGASASFTLTGTVSATAAGNLVNTASIAVPSGFSDRSAGNNAASDVDEVLVPVADLSITKTNNATTLVAGAPVSYTLVVSNPAAIGTGSGQSNTAVTGATVTDSVPAAITGVTWTCTASAGSSCPASGSGNTISAAVSLAQGGSATFTVNGTVGIAASGTLTNVASVAVPAAVTDPNAANNSASDADPVVAFPAPTLRDNFNRANSGSLGANWSQFNLGFGVAIAVNSNQAFCVTNGLCALGGIAVWNSGGGAAVFGARQAAAFTVANGTLNGDSVLLKASGGVATSLPGNYIRVRLTANAVAVTTTTDGGITTTSNQTISNANSTFVSGDTLTALVDAAGTVYVWKNGTHVGSVSLPNAALWTSGTGRVGVLLPQGARIDNFAGGTAP